MSEISGEWRSELWGDAPRFDPSVSWATPSEVLVETDEQIAAIDKALEDFAEHKTHVPEAYLPEPVQTIGTAAHENLLAYLDNIGIETFAFQEQVLRHLMDNGVDVGVARLFAKHQTPPGLRSPEETRERLARVKGATPRMVILDEGMPGEQVWHAGDPNPLFGRQDAGLDDLEPDGPIWMPPEDEPDEIDWTVSAEDPEVPAATPGPAPLRLLGRTLRACVAFAWSRTPGRGAS